MSKLAKIKVYGLFWPLLQSLGECMDIFSKIIHRLILNKLTKKKKRVNDIKKKIVWEREREQTIKERKNKQKEKKKKIKSKREIPVRMLHFGAKKKSKWDDSSKINWVSLQIRRKLLGLTKIFSISIPTKQPKSPFSLIFSLSHFLSPLFSPQPNWSRATQIYLLSSSSFSFFLNSFFLFISFNY